MENVHDRNSNQFAPPSLIEFLLGDGIRPGWLDKQYVSMYMDDGIITGIEVGTGHVVAHTW
jgi:hypothetical protein